MRPTPEQLALVAKAIADAAYEQPDESALSDDLLEAARAWHIIAPMVLEQAAQAVDANAVEWSGSAAGYDGMLLREAASRIRALMKPRP